MISTRGIPAPCRTHGRAAFRRVAGGALPMRGRGEAAVARDARPYHGGLQRFQRMRIEEKGHNAHIDFITHCLGYYECVCKIVNVFAYGDSVRLHAHDCVECVRDFARVGKTANSAHHDGHKRIKHFIAFEIVPFNDIAQVNCFVEERWLFKSCEDTSFVKGGCSGCFRLKIRSAA